MRQTESAPVGMSRTITRTVSSLATSLSSSEERETEDEDNHMMVNTTSEPQMRRVPSSLPTYSLSHTSRRNMVHGEDDDDLWELFQEHAKNSQGAAVHADKTYINLAMLYFKNNEHSANLFKALDLEQMDQHTLVTLIRNVDKDVGGSGDDKLDFEEFKEVVSLLRQKCTKLNHVIAEKEDQTLEQKVALSKREHPQESTLFAWLDSDHNGCIDLDEWRADAQIIRAARQKKLLTLPDNMSDEKAAALVKPMYKAADVDDSGFVDWFEFLNFMQSLRNKTTTNSISTTGASPTTVTQTPEATMSTSTTRLRRQRSGSL